MSSIIALILVAVILFALEVVLPGGILGTIGGLAFLGAVYLTWSSYGAVAAIIVFMAGVVLTIVFFIIQINVLPKTRLGKNIILGTTTPGKSNVDNGGEALIGAEGVTLSKMVPTGTVRIGPRKLEAITQGGMLEKGETVVVVERDAFRVVVRKKEG